MKFLRKFNEDIQREDPKVIIDEILDRLSKKGKLSTSEKEFMDAAAANKITGVTVPGKQKSVWMTNPHNLGIMYQLDGVWKQLKTVDEEEDEELEKTETSDQSWERRMKREQLKYAEENPGLKEALNAYLDMKIKQEKELMPFIRDIKKFEDYRKNYNLTQKIQYALDSKESLFNQFGYILDKKIDHNTGEYIDNK